MEAEHYFLSSYLDKMPTRSLSWGAALTMGLVTLVIGALLLAGITPFVAVTAVLLGVVFLVTGVYYVVRAVVGREGNERAWRGVCGVVFVLVGLTLLRHPFLGITLIGLVIGFAWIIQGVLLLMESFSRARRRARTGWTMFFGVISLIAGIAIIASPITSVVLLTLYVGAWFIVMGLMGILGSFVMRRAVRHAPAAAGVSVPQQRATAEVAADQRAADQRAADQRAADQRAAAEAAADQRTADRGSADRGSADPGSADPGSADRGTASDSRPTYRRWHIPH
jgi:uncharacterized membrane protein HdeD (DUF308 family)